MMKPFSRREKEVYALVIQGYGHKEIAHHMGISPRTINAHIASMREKTQSITNAQMVYKILTQKEV